MFSGAMVAIVTPFKNGKFDRGAYKRLIDLQIAEGTDAIIPCGTTGESATLDFDEHSMVVGACVKAVRGRVPVIAGTGANSTDEAIMLTKDARDLGADGALLVSPYYNKPSQEGIYRHYKKIAGAVSGFPLVLYNVPGRTASNILPATVARLSRISNIVGIKEATANMRQATEIIALCGKNFDVLSGDDFTTFPLYALGGRGGISVSANVLPGMQAAMWDAWQSGDLSGARGLHNKLDRLNAAMFIETNPVPVKTALAMMGLIKEEFRLPLCPMSRDNKAKLRAVLRSYKLVR